MHQESQPEIDMPQIAQRRAAAETERGVARGNRSRAREKSRSNTKTTSFSGSAGAVYGFPRAEAPAAFPETGAYSHEKEDTQYQWFFYDPLA